MGKKTRFVVSLAVLGILLAGAFFLYQNLGSRYKSQAAVPEGTEETEESPQPQKIPAPDFTAESVKGKRISLSSFYGKPIVLNFWASWCPPCKGEMPEFEKQYKKYSKNIEFIMLNMTDGSRETKKTADNFIKKNHYTFPVYYDVKQEAVYNFQVRAYPTTFFIDKQGNIIAGIEGAMDEDTLESQIGELLKEK